MSFPYQAPRKKRFLFSADAPYLTFEFSKYTRTLENLAASNIDLTEDEKKEISGVLNQFTVKGSRSSISDTALWG